MNKILIVNKEDVPIGEAEKSEAREKGLYHRVVRILVFNSKGDLLLQKRSENAKDQAGFLDQSAGGHVDEGEIDPLVAAKRELAEEIGIENVELKYVGKYFMENIGNGNIVRRFNYVYTCEYDGEFELQEKEVDEISWFSISELEDLLSDSNSKITLGLRKVLEDYVLNSNS